MPIIRLLIGPLATVLTDLLTEFLTALAIEPKPWHAAAVKLLVASLLLIGLGGLAAAGITIDWTTVVPLLGPPATP